MRTMEEQRSKLRSKIKDYEKSGASETKKQTSNHKASDFHIGDTVQVLSMGTRGTITKLPDNKGIAGVQMGILNSMLPISDLLIIPESTVSVNGTKQKYSGKHAGGDHTSVSKSMTFSPELNVMGKQSMKHALRLTNIWMMQFWHTFPVSRSSTEREPVPCAKASGSI